MRFNGGTEVPVGYYYNTQTWEIVSILEDGDKILPTGSYISISSLFALVVVAPLLGLLFMLALPVIGFILVGKLIFIYTSTQLMKLSRELLTVLAVKLEPGVSYFTGWKKRYFS